MEVSKATGGIPSLTAIRGDIRCQGEVLDRILEQHCRCELKDDRGAANSSAIVAAVQTLVQEHTAKLHASHSLSLIHIWPVVPTF